MFISKPTIDGLRTSIDLIFQNSLIAAPPFSDAFTYLATSTTGSQTYPFADSLPKYRRWDGPRLILNINEQFTRIDNVDFEHTFGVSVNDLADDNIGTLNMKTALAAKAAGAWKDQLVKGALQTGSTTLLAHDGLSLFNANHTLNPAGVQSNNIIAASGPDATGWDTVRAAMSSYTGADGEPLGVSPNLIIVPPQLETKALTALTAVYGASGASNVNLSQAKVLVVPHLANEPTIWYAADTRHGLQGIIFQLREAPNVVALTNATDVNVVMQNQYLWCGKARGAAGAGFWPFIARIRPS